LIKNLLKHNLIKFFRLICDLLWADPDTNEELDGWGENERGVSYTFNQNVNI